MLKAKSARPRSGRVAKRTASGDLRKTTLRWSEVELKALMQAVEQQKEESLDGGSINWSIVAKMVKYRTGKQCREKYLNHLRPNIKKSAWTPREEYILARRHAVSGNRWAEISSHLPGRVENDIKNLWNATRRAKPESKQHSLLWHYAHGLEALGLRPKEALLQAVHKYLALPNVEHLAIDVDRLKRELDRSDDSGTMPELGAAPYVADEEDDDEAIDLDELSDLSEEEDEDLPLPATMGRPVLRASRADEDEEMEEAGSQQRVLADATNISRSTSSVKADAASLGPVRPIIAGPTMHLPQQHASSAPDRAPAAPAPLRSALSAEQWLLNHADEFLTEVPDIMLSVDPAAAAAAAATARAADVAPVAGAVAAAAAAGYTESPMQPPPRCAAAVPSTSSQPPPRAPPSAPHTTTAHGFRSLLPAATPTTLLRKQALLRHMALGSEAVAGSSGGAGATTSGAQPSTSATAASKGTPQTAEEFVRKAPVEPFTGPTSSQGDAATGEKRVAGRLIDWHTPALPKRADQVICFTRTIFSAGDAALARPPDSAAPCTASPSAHAPACLSEPAAGKHTPLWKHSPLFTGDTTIFSPSDFALKQFGVTPLLPARPLTQPALFDTAGPKTSAVPAVPPTAPGASIPAAAVVGPAAVVALAAAPVDSPAMRFAL